MSSYVYDRFGHRVGEVNAWTCVYDADGFKAGSINVWTNSVTDEYNRHVGSADSYGNVYGVTGRKLCSVPFWGDEVVDTSGNLLGKIGLAGAPEPPMDMQWRGAAALLLLCADMQKADIDAIRAKAKAEWEAHQNAIFWASAKKAERERRFTAAAANGVDSVKEFLKTPEGKIYKSEHWVELLLKGLLL